MQHRPVINPWHSTWLVEQQRLDDEPFLGCKFIPTARHPTSVSEARLNHAKGNTQRFLRVCTLVGGHLEVLCVDPAAPARKEGQRSLRRHRPAHRSKEIRGRADQPAIARPPW